MKKLSASSSVATSLESAQSGKWQSFNDSLLSPASQSFSAAPIVPLPSTEPSLLPSRRHSVAELRLSTISPSSNAQIVPHPTSSSSYSSSSISARPTHQEIRSLSKIEANPLNDPYDEIFGRARRQLERIANTSANNGSNSVSVKDQPVLPAYANGAPFPSTNAPSDSVFTLKEPLNPSWQRVGQSPYSISTERLAPPPVQTVSPASPLKRTPSSPDRVSALSPMTAESQGVVGPAAFEREALALQAELAQMQQTLKDRMRRYQVLSHNR